MTEINYSAMLRELVDEYFEHRLTRVEYLAQRRGLLDRIDHEFNGDDITSGWPESDTTQPQDLTDPGPSPDDTNRQDPPFDEGDKLQ